MESGMAVKTKKRLYFLKPYGSLNAGEVAGGYEEHVAKKLIDRGVAEDADARAKALEAARAAKAAKEAQAEAPEAPEAEEPEAPSKREELEALNVDDLKKQLGELGLPVTGKKAELVDRLLEEEG
jgi:20S proteasome alpha/beta subunit